MKIPLHSPGPAYYSYEIFPRVALLNTPCTFCARGLGDDKKLTPGKTYCIWVLPREQNASAHTLEISRTMDYDCITVVADEEGYLRFTCTFDREQLYILRLQEEDPTASKRTRLNDFRVFCAAEDLYGRTPMRGNAHCHTYCSDGHEDPYLAAAFYRKAGYDYVAITDHHTVAGSMHAINVSKRIPSELALYYGEEVHVPNPYIHAVNVGVVLEGNMGLDHWYHAHEEEVKAKVARIAEEWKDRLPAGIMPHDFAWRKWIADTIHENGGIAIMAHPMWEYDTNNTPDDMVRFLAEQRIYDGVEILHGQWADCMDANMQVGFWSDLRAAGIEIAPIGADDAHRRTHPWDEDCSFNEAYTVIFAKDPSFEGFAEAVRGGYTAAVESYEGAPEHVVANYRFTKYLLFLLEQYFPYHDELCFEEGNRMRDCYLGDATSGRILEMIHGRVKAYADRFFGRA